MPNLNDRLARWRADPVAFIEQVLINPETGKPFELYEAQKRFIRDALTLLPDGRLPYPELLYSCPKKSGKTATSAMVVIYIIVVLGGPMLRLIVSRTISSRPPVASFRRSRGSSRRHPCCATRP